MQKNKLLCPVCKTETLSFVITENKITYYVCSNCQIEHAEYTTLKNNKKYKLKDMLDGITPENIHEEILL